MQELDKELLQAEMKMQEMFAPVLDDDKQHMEYPKEAHELGMAIYSIVKATKEALADGFQASDVPEILMKSVSELMNAVKGIEKIPGEFKEDFGKALMAILKPVLDAVKLLLAKGE